MKLTRMMIPILIMAMATLAACSGCTANPFKAAEGVDEQAYAVLGTYAIYQRQALKVVQDVSLPASIRSAAAQADAAAFPILKTLDSALVDALNAKAALDAGASTKEKVAIAFANLQKWVTEGRKAVAELKDAVTTARKVLALFPPPDYSRDAWQLAVEYRAAGLAPDPLNLAWSL